MARPTAFEIGRYGLIRTSRGWMARWWVEEQGRRRRRVELIGAARATPEKEARVAFSKWCRQHAAAEAQNQVWTVADLMARYIDDRRAAGRNADKMEWQWAALKPHFAGLQPADLTVESRGADRRPLNPCQRYAVARHADGIARDTIHSELSLLRSAMSWSVKRGLINPVFVWVSQPGPPRRTALSGEEVIALLGAIVEAAPHIRLLITIALATGARKQAILDLTWDRVDLDHHSIDFRGAEIRDILDTSHRKGRAVVDMGGALHEALTAARALAQTDHVIEYRGRPVKDPNEGVKAVFEAAGLGRRFLGLHALRHTLATSAAEHGIDMAKIRDMLGHVDVRTTERVYVELRRGHLRDVAAVADAPLRRMIERR